MEYLKIKKSVFMEIVIYSLIGMFISLLSVIYLANKIVALNKTIINFENQKPAVVYIEKEAYKDNIQDTIINISQANHKVSPEDRELLARLLYCEGRGESVECQRAIISVIINRLNSGSWGNSISSVVYASGQFEPVSSGLINNAKPSKTQYDVVDYVLENGSTLPKWVMYFRASYHFNWNGYTPYCSIDNTYFGGMQ